MKNLTTCLCAAALALASFAANATTFDFSYSFDKNNTGDGNPVVLTGSFTGTQVGDLISGISDIQLALNGTAFSGPLQIESFNSSTNNWDAVTAPVMSTDATKLNFIIADADVANNPGAVSNYFFIQGGQAFAVTFNTTDALSNPLSGFESTNSAQWSLTAAAVPEPSSYALMLAGLASIGLLVQRRRSV